MSNGERQDPIRMVPYDTRWPDDFDRERARIESVLAPWLTGPVEHIGSTAVPGLAAKSIIDMTVCVSGYDDGAAAVSAFDRIGWVHAPEPGVEAGGGPSAIPAGPGAPVVCTSTRPGIRSRTRRSPDPR